MDTEYIYNALGQRIEKHTGEEIENYLLDLTKSYHNLLGLKRDAEEQMFYYDFWCCCHGAIWKDGSIHPF